MRTLLGAAVAAGVVAAATLTGCGRGSMGQPEVKPPTPGAAPVAPTGFRAAVVQITRADGTVESHCVWLATTDTERQRGLMEVTSLGGADGMLFRFDGETTSSFWMKDTVLPLSIAFFASDGAFVSATDMTPCPADTSSCPRYDAEGRYTDALEVVQGDLPALGIVQDSRLTVTKAACRPNA